MATKDVVRRTLDQTSRLIEQARRDESEVEAWTLLGSKLLLYPPGAILNLPDDLRGGLNDAFRAVADVIEEGVTSIPQPETRMEGGQWAKAVHKSVQAHAVAEAASKAGAILKKRSHSALKAQLKNLRKLAHSSNIWMELFDENMRVLREYNQQVQDVPSKKQRFGRPGADGYDLESPIGIHLKSVVAEDTFSAEEMFGKYLDLSHVYQEALHSGLLSTLANENKDGLQYVDFLNALASGRLKDIASGNKNKSAHLLRSIYDYLVSFQQRTLPLLDISSYTSENQRGDIMKVEELELDLSKCKTASDVLRVTTADTLKDQLRKLGLKCGGSLMERAQRLLLYRNCKSVDDLPKKVWARNRKSQDEINDRSELCVIVQALLGQVQPTLLATIRRCERRLTQSAGERQRESIEEAYGTMPVKESNEDGSDDDNVPIYNPKNVPLDWDGKPIPYWLFKLHGLNHYFSCEICGGETFRGRRNFELHFNEQKHSAGMKNLGIPNTKHFHGITSIDDALRLWETISAKMEANEFDNVRDEEYEDSHGNVLTRKKYEELARQGML